MKKINKIISLVLVIAMMLMPVTTVNAQDYSNNTSVTVTPSDPVEMGDFTLDSEIEKLYLKEDSTYSDEDVVRAIIVLNEEPVTCYEQNVSQLITSDSARSAINRVEKEQFKVQAVIEHEVLGGRPLDVEYNYSYAINGIAASLTYGELKEIRKLRDIKYAVISEQYDLYPMTSDSSAMVGAQDTWAAGYDGEGMRIAIIDTGIDTDHPSFAANGINISDSPNYLTRKEVSNVLPKLKAFERGNGGGSWGLYLNDKIPFGYNYVDKNLKIDHDINQTPHGSHVAGISAANKLDTTEVVGIAPKAQLLVMKVFGVNGGAYSADILAAIEDSLLLNADVINLSLGSDGGFTNDSKVMEDALENAAKTDVILCFAAGNNSSSALGNERLTDAPLTESPDNGIVGSPGTFTKGLSVASLDNSVIISKYIEIGNKKMPTTDSKNIASLSSLAGTATKYVILGDPNTGEGIYGEEADFPTGDFSNTIAIVSRGNTLFSDKHLNAANAGFAGLVIYNNKNGTFAADVSASGKDIPVGTITASAAAHIFSKSTYDTTIGAYTGTINISATEEKIPSITAYAVSDFSSCGPAPDLRIKPEISGVGGNIYSAVDNGQYAVNSGTSMATPQVAGVAALVLQHLHQEYPDMSDIDARVIAQSLLMSTAAVVMSDEETQLPYSPRNQGAGLVNAFNSVKSKAYLSVAGSEKPKAELGDDKEKTGVYKITFDVENLGNEPLDYKLKTYTLTEDHFTGPDGLEYMAQASKALNPNVEYTVTTATTDKTLDFSADSIVDTNDIWMLYKAIEAGTAGDAKWKIADFNKDGIIDANDLTGFLATVNRSAEYKLYEGDNTQITVPAGGATITATITLSGQDKAYMDSIFENGIYVDGFVKLEAVANEKDETVVDLNLPFLAFYGDWTESPMIDNTYIADLDSYVEREMYFPNIVWTGKNSYLGVNSFAEDDKYISERSNVLSPKDNLQVITDYYLSLLRNARSITTTITNKTTGATIWSDKIEYARKSSFSPTDATIIPVSWQNEKLGQETTFWPTVAEDTNDGDEVILKIAGELDYGTASEQNNGYNELVLPIRIDETAPTLVDGSLDFVYKPLEGEKGTKTLSFKVEDDKYVAAVVVFNSTGTKVISRHAINQTEPGIQTEMVIDVSEAKSKVKIAVCDYGSNISYYDIDFKIDGDGSDFDTTKLFGYRLGTPKRDPLAWVTFDGDDYAKPTIVYDDSKEFSQYTAAEYYDKNVYAVNKDGDFYAMPFNKLGTSRTKIANFKFMVGDMAYDYSTNRMLGLADNGADNISNGKYMSVVVLDHKDVIAEKDYEVAFRIAKSDSNDPLYLITLACRSDGQLYGIENETGKLYDLGKYSDVMNNPGQIINAKFVGDTGYYPNMVQSMAFDHNTGKLYWAKGGGSAQFYLANMLEIDVETAKVIDLGKTDANITGLFVPYTDENATPDPVNKLVIEQGDKLNIIKGSVADLTVQVIPWTADKNVIWSSNDESVVTVNKTGHIVAVNSGSTKVKVSAKTNPAIFDIIDITVKDYAADIGGYVAVNESSESHALNVIYGWTEFSTDNITPIQSGTTGSAISAGVRSGDELEGFTVNSFETAAINLTLQKYDISGKTTGTAIELKTRFGVPKDEQILYDVAKNSLVIGGAEFYTFSIGKKIVTARFANGVMQFLSPVDLHTNWATSKVFDPKASAVVGLSYNDSGDILYCIDNIGNLYKLNVKNGQPNVSTFKLVAKTNTGVAWSKGTAMSSMCYNSINGMLYFAQAQSTGITNMGTKFYAIDPTNGDAYFLGKSNDIISMSAIYIK